MPRCETSGTGRPSPLPALAARPLAARLTRAGRHEGLAAHVVRYRHRGWNGAAAHPVADAGWALEEVVRRYGDVPVCLIGIGLGARAALRVADHPAVEGVMGIAPWFPSLRPAAAPGARNAWRERAAGAPAEEALAAPHAAESARPSAEEGGEEATGPAAEPEFAAPPAGEDEDDDVRRLLGRRVLLVHGTNDRRASPDASYRYAQRAKKVNPDVCRFEVHADGHRLRQYRSEVQALAVDFTLGCLFARPFARPLQDAFAAPPPLGLAMPLASGFGGSLDEGGGRF
ncbi:alpha/beta hydrolase [Streptomyces sp. NPDC059740]|uniref:alpha/beta hydrolase n=1 Tax=Streptomyces sp. NPDC059740 TaxID=3346926 RepID=UPI003646CF49